VADSQQEVVSAILCKRLTSHGVPVNATDRAYWRTALHGAAAKGDIKTIRYLVSKGANVNAIDRAGDSPLELAVSNHQDSASRLLADLGARKIRGDAAQREKAIHDEVRDDINALSNR
jgi:ankyrin repeat protein